MDYSGLKKTRIKKWVKGEPLALPINEPMKDDSKELSTASKKTCGKSVRVNGSKTTSLTFNIYANIRFSASWLNIQLGSQSMSGVCMTDFENKMQA